MHNSDIIRELNQVLKDMDFFSVYPASKGGLQDVLSRTISDSGKIRAILSDPDVQEFLFADWREIKNTVIDPVDYYIEQRRTGRITPR